MSVRCGNCKKATASVVYGMQACLKAQCLSGLTEVLLAVHVLCCPLALCVLSDSSMCRLSHAAMLLCCTGNGIMSMYYELNCTGQGKEVLWDAVCEQCNACAGRGEQWCCHGLWYQCLPAVHSWVAACTQKLLGAFPPTRMPVCLNLL